MADIAEINIRLMARRGELFAQRQALIDDNSDGVHDATIRQYQSAIEELNYALDVVFQESR